MPDILVVDDEVTIREPLRAFLEHLGHDVTECEDGLAALTMLTQRDFDLVITDVMMPRMNGFQFLERALPHVGDRLPILMLTSMDDEAGVEAAIFAGAFDYLLKPCEPERAEAVINQALTQRREALAKIGPGRRGPPVPVEALDAAKLAPEAAPKVVPPSGRNAFKQRKGMIQVARPPSSKRTAAAADQPVGLLGRLKGLFGRRDKAA